jgi:aspartate kinase
LAAALNADACEIYTDVDGVYTADPRKVKSARKLDYVTYDEMLELATLGAGVLHNRSVELAKKFGVQLVVRSSLNTSEGTIVKEDTGMEKMIVSGVAADADTARVAVIGLEDTPGVAFKLFNVLAKNDINVDMILQSVGRHGTKDISFTCSGENADKAEEIIKKSMKFESIDVEKSVAKVSIVGAGMQSNAGVAAKMFEALYDENINIRMISTSEIRVTVLIDEQYTERAMNAIHDKFALGDK